MTIKTYRPTNKPTGSLMEQHEHGDWVKASYAVMLEQQLASEKAETERFRALAENQTEAVKTYLAQLADSRSETARLTAELARVEKERDEAREWVRRITQDSRTLNCAFCGYAYPPGTPTSNHELLSAHVKQCPKHPLAMDIVELRADLDICMDALERLSHIGNFTTTLHSNICEAGRHEIEARIEYANEWKKKTRQWQTADKETNDDATAPEGD